MNNEQLITNRIVMKNQRSMRQFWLRRGLRFLMFGILFVGLAGLAVMSLWNALLPDILGVSAISFGQALGLLVLSRLLFGGFGRGGFGPGRGGWGERRREWKEKMGERWQNMTPEQRDQLKTQWRDRCGNNRRGYGPRPDATNPETPAEPIPTAEKA
jgi:hypothetical protein